MILKYVKKILTTPYELCPLLKVWSIKSPGGRWPEKSRIMINTSIKIAIEIEHEERKRLKKK